MSWGTCNLPSGVCVDDGEGVSWHTAEHLLGYHHFLVPYCKTVNGWAEFSLYRCFLCLLHKWQAGYGVSRRFCRYIFHWIQDFVMFCPTFHMLTKQHSANPAKCAVLLFNGEKCPTWQSTSTLYIWMTAYIHLQNYRRSSLNYNSTDYVTIIKKCTHPTINTLIGSFRKFK